MRYLALALVFACGGAETVAPRPTHDPNADLSSLFEAQFQRRVTRSPMFQTYLGIKKDYGKWDDISDERTQDDHELAKQDLLALKKFQNKELSPQNRASLRLAIYKVQTQIDSHQWRFHSFPVTQMYGLHSTVPSFLANQHKIDSISDAEAYVQRLRGVQPMFEVLERNLRARQEKTILPPRFVFDKVISDSKNIISGAPMTRGKDSVLWADFKKKVDGLADLPEDKKKQLYADAKAALKESVAPAYKSLIDLMKTQKKLAGTDDGVWRLPDGDAFYQFALKRTTTVDLTADEIHNIGLSEVARLHEEMRAIMKQVEFRGDIQAFFRYLKKDRKFRYPNNKRGREAYLADARAIIETMEKRLPELFLTLPKAGLEVKAVEPYREKSAGKAFYNGPAPDGSRPGIYYANLYDMTDMPKYQMEALAYHEAVPGHHMQIAIAQELTELPKFRRFSGYTVYSEGWGLYSEFLPKELGFYKDPYSDFGRLAMELWRACRLVVDTGIHAKKWTREQAIDYLLKNTPNPRGDAVKAIERYIIMPSQATGYKIGMLKILELREDAKQQLGDKFELREFHDVVLRSGPVPLPILEENVKAWVASRGG